MGKITSYTEDTVPSANDFVITVDAETGVNKKVKLSNLPTSQQVIQLKVFNDDIVVTTGDGKLIFVVSSDLSGTVLSSAHAYVTTASSSGTPTVQIRNVTDAVDILSTRITIDASETTSYTAATPSVVNTANDDVSTGDLIAVDVDVAGTGAYGLGVVLTFD